MDDTKAAHARASPIDVLGSSIHPDGEYLAMSLLLGEVDQSVLTVDDWVEAIEATHGIVCVRASQPASPNSSEVYYTEEDGELVMFWHSKERRVTGDSARDCLYVDVNSSHIDIELVTRDNTPFSED